MGFGYDQSWELQLRPEPEDKLAVFFQPFGPDSANVWGQKPVPPFRGRAFLALTRTTYQEKAVVAQMWGAL